MLDKLPPELLVQLAQAMGKDDGVGALEQEVAAADRLGPEGLTRMIGLGTLDQRSKLAGQGNDMEMALLQNQLSQAQDFAKPQGKNYGTVAGNVAGGIGDVARGLFGGIQARNLQGQQRDAMAKGQATQAGFLDQQDAGRGAMGDARIQALKSWLASRNKPEQPVAQSDAHLLEPLI